MEDRSVRATSHACEDSIRWAEEKAGEHNIAIVASGVATVLETDTTVYIAL